MLIAIKYALGPKAGTKFWCGFCREVVSTESGGEEWSKVRLDHIIEHLFYGVGYGGLD